MFYLDAEAGYVVHLSTTLHGHHEGTTGLYIPVWSMKQCGRPCKSPRQHGAEASRMLSWLMGGGGQKHQNASFILFLSSLPLLLIILMLIMNKNKHLHVFIIIF